MKVNLHIIWVLIKKDVKMMFNNKNFLVMLLMPLGFAFLYQAIFSGNEINSDIKYGTVLTMCQIFNILMVPLSGLSIMVSEEKEKNTLRVLMLNDVSAAEYIIAKIITVLFAMEIVSSIIFVVTDTTAYLAGGLLITTMAAISMLLIGAMLGMLCKDQMSTGTMTVPFLLLFMFPAMFGSMMGGIIETLSRFVPTSSMQYLLSAILEGSSMFAQNYLLDWAVMIVWIFLGLAAFLYVYRKRGIDN